MAEKRAVIEPGRTPDAGGSEKKATDLEDHVTKRAADAASEQLQDQEAKAS